MNHISVSVIIPVLNEEQYIQNAIQSIIEQDWSGMIEMVIVDGHSTDRTVKIIQDIQAKLPENRSIKLCENPASRIPISLNIACANASYEVIVRTDGHTYAPPIYILEMVRALQIIDFKGIVGGRWEIHPGAETCVGQAIAISASHPFGVGNAAYRTLKGDFEQLIDVDTVPFGAFTKSLWKDLGGYDETILYDEDYDYNYRIKMKGYRVVLNPKIILKYFSRKTLSLLWVQYYRYGYWANRFCLKHKMIPTIRRFVPTGFVLGLFLSPFIDFRLLLFLVMIYITLILIISFNEGVLKRKKLSLALCLVPVFPVLHLSYGFGSIISLLNIVYIKSYNYFTR